MDERTRTEASKIRTYPYVPRIRICRYEYNILISLIVKVHANERYFCVL